MAADFIFSRFHTRIEMCREYNSRSNNWVKFKLNSAASRSQDLSYVNIKLNLLIFKLGKFFLSFFFARIILK